MDPARREQVTVIDLGPDDLAGAMLRKSFSRPPNRALYVRPFHGLLIALLTAGLMPTGLLIRRLWLYASHQRFRATELAEWLADGKSLSGQALRWIRPTGLIVAAGGVWSIATMLAVYAGLTAVTGWTPAVRIRGLYVEAMALTAMLQILSVLILRMRVERCLCMLCNASGHDGSGKRAFAALRSGLEQTLGRSAIPLASLWPMLMVIPWSLVWLAGWRTAAAWLAGGIMATLAAEVQRGYITVSDRRMRYALARRINALLRRSGNGR